MPNDPKVFHAFTITANSQLKEIITDVGISVAYDHKSEPKKAPPIQKTKALWDTGATNSVITSDTSKALKLKPFRKVKVYHGGGSSIENVYYVTIYLPNGLFIPNVAVTECKDISGRFGAIIGMDIICYGDFAITNIKNKTTFSFRLPSIEKIDYVQEANKVKKIISKKVGRNDPCPCGSGKKFKKCHGK